MCGTPLWGIVGAVASAYFAYLSYSHLASGDFSWTHSWWTVLTYAVWVTVIGGLLTEKLCLRERIFFTLMLLIVSLGLGFSAWSRAPEHAIRQLRMASTALWALAAIASLTTAFGPKNKINAVQRDSPEEEK
jgi:disulfide bond formation protein DsbB